ncbi:MAG: hypothetical protein AAGI49_06155, partial [Bacteroidota bacterium]
MRYIILIFTLAVLAASCEPQLQGTTIKGELTGAADLQVYLDEVQDGDKTVMLTKVQADPNGQFSMNFPDGLKSSIYRLKIGRQEIDLVFDGSEKVVNVSGDLSKLKEYQVEVSGSKAAETMVSAMQKLYAREMKLANIEEFVDTTENALVATMLVMKAVPIRGDLLNVHKKALNKLSLANPNLPLTATYQQALTQ